MGTQAPLQNGRNDCPNCGTNLGAVMRISDSVVTEVFCPSPDCLYSKDVNAPPEGFPSTLDLG